MKRRIAILLVMLIAMCAALVGFASPIKTVNAVAAFSWSAGGDCASVTAIGNGFPNQPYYIVVGSDTSSNSIADSTTGDFTISMSFSSAFAPDSTISVDLYEGYAGQESFHVGTTSYVCPPLVPPTPGIFSTCPKAHPILGAVVIGVGNRLPGLDAPGKDIAKDGSGNNIYVPPLVKVDGQNEYLVIDVQTYNGKVWYGIFVGGCLPVYVPAAKVTVSRTVTQ